MVGCHRGDDDQINFAGRHIGLFEAFLRAADRKVAGRLAFGGVASRFDAGTLNDPVAVVAQFPKVPNFSMTLETHRHASGSDFDPRHRVFFWAMLAETGEGMLVFSWQLRFCVRMLYRRP